MDVLDNARAAFESHAWPRAYASFVDADRAAPLEPADLERLARAADLTGHDAECDDAWSRAYNQWLEQGQAERAARCAFWLGQKLMARGEPARGGGWVARARQLLADGRDCVEQGLLLLPQALQTLFVQGDPGSAYAMFTQAAEIGTRFNDADLKTLAHLGMGRTLIAMNRFAEGVALLDEVMVAATAAEVSPVVVGIVYCATIDACYQMLDLRRAHEWTTALTQWCEAQPGLVAFRAECLVRRSELMRLRGAWPAALTEAQRAVDLLSGSADQPTLAAAAYQQAECYRLRGEWSKAEDAYREAARLGGNPQPGLALLRLAQGQLSMAVAAISRALDETHDPTNRSALLAASVDIMLAADDVAAAESASTELGDLAAAIGVQFLHALSSRATGAVLLASGDARAALGPLRHAATLFRETEAPYECARARELIGLAYRKLGDSDSAALELDSARSLFSELGAAPDAERLQPTRPGPLSRREVEVIRLVAGGKTNRTIAQELGLSEKTVARHIANIFTKLSLSSRAAATAYAFTHGLVDAATYN